MTWEEICADPALADLPYRIESDKWGNIIMSPPAGADHSDYQGEMILLLSRLMRHGHARPECPVRTNGGVKAVDVVWMSAERRKQRPAGSIVYLAAPEICVEVRSPSNSFQEIVEKIQLYFEAAAQECWICDQMGQISFFNASGPMPRSALCPKFPSQIDPAKNG